jgi:hypothetical protein
LEHRVKVELLIKVCVAEVFDILAQVAEEEDILFSNLTGDLGLRVSHIQLQAASTLLTSMFAPSQVPMMRPPFSTNFMLLSESQ